MKDYVQQTSNNIQVVLSVDQTSSLSYCSKSQQLLA